MKPSLCVLLLALLICPFAQAEDVEWVWYAVPDVDNIHAVQILDDNPIAQFAVASEDGFTVYGPLSNWIPLLEDVEVHP